MLLFVHRRSKENLMVFEYDVLQIIWCAVSSKSLTIVVIKTKHVTFYPGVF